MNTFIRSTLRNIAHKTSWFLSKTELSIASLLRICVLSSPYVAWKSTQYYKLRNSDTCCILGNGPSLKNALEKDEINILGNDIMAVNMFCKSEFFTKIRPRFYFIIDGAYFSPKNERHEKMIDELITKLNEVEWNMFLFVSSSCVKGRLFQELKNSYIKVLPMNSTTFDGFSCIRHFFYRHHIAMPRCQTVINFALGSAIAMRYNRIQLYGADHSWTRDLFVDDDNVVCYGDRHVYKTELTVIKKKDKLSTLLRQFAYMFEAHEIIAEYAKSVGCEIQNCTKNSFIDSYKRK